MISPSLTLRPSLMLAVFAAVVFLAPDGVRSGVRDCSDFPFAQDPAWDRLGPHLVSAAHSTGEDGVVDIELKIKEKKLHVPLKQFLASALPYFAPCWREENRKYEVGREPWMFVRLRDGGGGGVRDSDKMYFFQFSNGFNFRVAGLRRCVTYHWTALEFAYPDGTAIDLFPDDFTGRLTVEPDDDMAPRLERAEVGYSRAVVDFHLENGACEVNGVNVICDGGIQITADDSMSDIKLTDLFPDTAYDCKIIVGYTSGNKTSAELAFSFRTGRPELVLTTSSRRGGEMGVSLDNGTDMVSDSGLDSFIKISRVGADGSRDLVREDSARSLLELGAVTDLDAGADYEVCLVVHRCTHNICPNSYQSCQKVRTSSDGPDSNATMVYLSVGGLVFVSLLLLTGVGVAVLRRRRSKMSGRADDAGVSQGVVITENHSEYERYEPYSMEGLLRASEGHYH